MASLRLLFLASVIPTSFVACGGGDGQAPPSGPHYTSVANAVTVPANNTQARELGLDLDNDPAHAVDNQLGMVLGTLANQGFKVQDTVDDAVKKGSIILLLDLQTPSFTSTSGAALQVKLGATPSPAPCTDPADLTTCGKHLAGTGSFTVASGSATDSEVEGTITGGVFKGGPGNLSLQIALGGSEPINLDLIGARVKATGLSATGITEAILAGAITQSDLDTKVIPSVHAQLGPILTRDCQPSPPPDCGCIANSTGKTILGLFDTMPKDCTVSIDEIKKNSLIQSLLSPDVTIEGVAALSLGIKVATVPATVN